MRILFHLVSGQNSQVYIMSRFYKPAFNVLFYTESTRKNLPALREVLKGSTVKEVLIHPFKYPKIRKVLRQAVDESNAKNPEMIFNITGGTKIQSIAMYEVAQEKYGKAAYLDSENHNIFELGGERTEQLPIADLAIDPIEYIHANGQKTRIESVNYSPNSRKLVEVLSKYHSAFKIFFNQFAASRKSKESHLFRHHESKGVIKGSFYEIGSKKFRLHLAYKGLQLFDVTENDNNDLIKDLAGGWLEKAAFNIITEASFLRKPVMGIKLLHPDLSLKNEFDILAMYGTDLCIFECKSGTMKMEDIDHAIAVKRILGLYTRLFIITLKVPSSPMKARLEEHRIIWTHLDDFKTTLEKLSSTNTNI